MICCHAPLASVAFVLARFSAASHPSASTACTIFAAGAPVGVRASVSACMDGWALSVSTSHGMRCFFGIAASDSTPATMPLYVVSQPLTVPPGQFTVLSSSDATPRFVPSRSNRRASLTSISGSGDAVPMRQAAAAVAMLVLPAPFTPHTMAWRVMSISADSMPRRFLTVRRIRIRPPGRRQRVGLAGCRAVVRG